MVGSEDQSIDMDHLDFDELEKKRSYNEILVEVREKAQEKFISMCRSEFNPLQIFANTVKT